MLTANPELQVRLSATTALDPFLDKPSDTVNVDGLERRNAKHTIFDVQREEDALNVITGETPRCLRQVVGAKAEEVGFARQVLGRHASAGQFNHAPNRDVQFDVILLRNLFQQRFDLVADQLKLTHRSDKRHHDLRTRIQSLCLQLSCRFSKSLRLQQEQARQVKAQADTTEPKHRVLLVQTANLSQQVSPLFR